IAPLDEHVAGVGDRQRWKSERSIVVGRLRHADMMADSVGIEDMDGTRSVVRRIDPACPGNAKGGNVIQIAGIVSAPERAIDAAATVKPNQRLAVTCPESAFRIDLQIGRMEAVPVRQSGA